MNRCPRCGRRMTWELDCYGGYVCWPCADTVDPEIEAWWDALLAEEAMHA